MIEIERTITTKNGVEIPFVELQTDDYGLLEDSLIFEDIIFDNKNFDSEAMCSERFKCIARTSFFFFI